MSKVQMSHASARVIEHLAQVGHRSLQDLVQKFPSSSQTDMSKRLRNLEQGWWLQRVGGAGNQLVYRVHPEAYAKLPSIGLQIPPPPSMAKRGSGRPRDVEPMPAADAVKPRRDNVWSAPVWKGWGQAAAPARAGSMDFMACPSRGF